MPKCKLYEAGPSLSCSENGTWYNDNWHNTTIKVTTLQNQSFAVDIAIPFFGLIMRYLPLNYQ